MKFSIAVDLGRRSAAESMEDTLSRVIDVVKFADAAGFEIAWAAEHHCIEYTIAPNPLTMLTHWANHTSQIRLGTAVLVAPYWHPIRLAGEIGLTDLLTGGRLEVGFGRGAYQYEFDRMAGGIPQQQGGAYLREIVPAVKKLWGGDYEHDGALWSFPKATAVPKPVQHPHPPLWVAARDPSTYDWAMKNGLNVMATPLSQPFSEVENLARKFEHAVAENPGVPRPRFMVLRTSYVYDSPDDWMVPVEAARDNARVFEALFTNAGGVVNGFPQPISLEEHAAKANFVPEAVHENLMFGTPSEVVRKLRGYEALGIDSYCYGANLGLPHDLTMRSLELFANEVMPHFAPVEAAAVAD